MNRICPECGYPLQGNEKSCPECGYPLQNETSNIEKNSTTNRISNNQQVREIDNLSQPYAKGNSEVYNDDEYQTFSELFWNCQFYKIFKGKYFDLGQRFYEFGVFLWEIVVLTWHTMWRNYANFTGRASRREFWSFMWGLPLLSSISFGILGLLGLIPLIAITIRRMHDVNKCGWWSCVPIACFFLYLKKSDEGVNRYGNPEPAKNLL